MPTVHRYMTMSPHTVLPGQPMSAAHQLMRRHGFHHLPVVDDGKLVGIVSDRDLRLGTPPSSVETTIDTVMTRCVLAVTPETPLDEAVAILIASKCHCLVVMNKTGVVGIFTASDGLRALSDILGRTAA